MELKVKKLSPDAMIPKYATEGAACFDLHAVIEAPVWSEARVAHHVNPDEPRVVRTRLAFEIPQDHVMLVLSRSGHGFKNDVRLSNCVGVIDSDYRGEVMVKLANDNPDGETFIVRHGDRVAQALVLPVQQVRFSVADELSDTQRGEGGFGSTNAPEQGELF